ncbi:hypothetical protein EBR04_10675 [bacterium]|nr:hypothetical protein [bacterium]
MVNRYEPRMESLQVARRVLVTQEKARSEELQREFQAAVNTSWMAGRMYFRGRSIDPTDHGAAPSSAIPSATTRILPDLYPHFVATQVTPAEVLQLLAPELAGPSQKFLTSELGILDLDAGRFAATCSGVVPTRIADHIAAEGGVGGTALLAHFGRPPYGYTANVVKACVAGLLRAGRIRIQPEGGAEITGFRDAGVRVCLGTDGPTLGGVDPAIAREVDWLAGSKGLVVVEMLTGLGAIVDREAFFLFAPIKIAVTRGGYGRALALVSEAAGGNR